MKVLLDLNVVLDVILNRQPWVTDSARVWNAHRAGRVDGCVAATEITNLFYIVRRLAGQSTARRSVGACLATFEIVAVDQIVLAEADRQPGSDFEDNVCIACAQQVTADAIVTRDPAGFAQSPVRAITPAELLAELASNDESTEEPE